MLKVPYHSTWTWQFEKAEHSNVGKDSQQFLAVYLCALGVVLSLS